MKKIILSIILVTLLLLQSCGDGGYYDENHSLVGLWASTDYHVLPADPTQTVKLYILPDKKIYFLYYNNLTDPLPLNNSVRGIILSNIDVSKFPNSGMFFEIQIQEQFDGASWNPFFQNLNIHIDYLGTTNFRFRRDVNWNYVLEETGDEMGYFMRLIE